MAREDLLGVLQLFADVLAHGVAGLGRHTELLQAGRADLAELLDADGEADDLVLRPLFELGRDGHAEHERQVGDLEAALREQGRERRLRGARDADEDEIGLLEVARLFAVVTLHGELDRLDAAVILLAEGQHAARRVDGLAVEERAQLADERADHVESIDFQLVRQRMNELAQLGRDHREHHERALARGALEDGTDAVLGTNARVQADRRPRVRKLEKRRANDLFGRFAGGVADDVDELSGHVWGSTVVRFPPRSTPRLRCLASMGRGRERVKAACQASSASSTARTSSAVVAACVRGGSGRSSSLGNQIA